MKRGQQIAWSGNTGYTGGPHLHFDLVNLLPEETSTLRVASPSRLRRPLRSVAAAFSCELPEPPLRAPLRLVDGAEVCGGRPSGAWIALADRDPAATFAQKVEALAAKGASAAVVANNRSGPELFAMGGCERASRIPCVLISKEQGVWLKRALESESVTLELAAHAATKKAEPMAAQLAALRARRGGAGLGGGAPLSCQRGDRVSLRTTSRGLCGASKSNAAKTFKRTAPERSKIRRGAPAGGVDLVRRDRDVRVRHCLHRGSVRGDGSAAAPPRLPRG